MCDKEMTVEQVFDTFDWIKMSRFAKRSNINYMSLRRYAISGSRYSERQAKKIEDALRQAGEELTKIKVTQINTPT